MVEMGTFLAVKKEEGKEEGGQQESFQGEIRVRCREKDMGNKSQESGRVASQGKKRQRREQVGHANITFPENRMEEQRESGKNGGGSMGEN